MSSISSSLGNNNSIIDFTLTVVNDDTMSSHTVVNQDMSYEMGQNYCSSNDFQSAVKEFETAANLGHPDAQYLLGMFYKQGIAVEKNMAAALNLFRSSSQMHHVEASFEVGFAYYLTQDFTNAIEYLRPPAREGHLKAQYYLGFCLHECSKPLEAMKWLTPIANKNDDSLFVHSARIRITKIQHEFAEAYLVNVDGNKKDDKRIINLLKESASYGNVEACDKLIYYYKVIQEDSLMVERWELLRENLVCEDD